MNIKSFYLLESSIILQCSNISPVEIAYFLVWSIPRHFSFYLSFEATVNRTAFLSRLSVAYKKCAVFLWILYLLCSPCLPVLRGILVNLFNKFTFLQGCVKWCGANSIYCLWTHSGRRWLVPSPVKGLPPVNNAQDFVASTGVQILFSFYFLFLNCNCHSCSSEWRQYDEFIYSPAIPHSSI